MPRETTEEALPEADLPATPRVFGEPHRPLFGMFHPARGALGETRATAIVLCNPFGYESLCVHRAYRHLARQLASAGFPVLRFDHHGTGDSSGDDREQDRVRAWIDGIHAAIDEAKACGDVSAVALIGVRLGATLATIAASTRVDVEALVLWAPLLTGKAFTRELRAFRLLRQQEGASESAPDDAASTSDEQGGAAIGEEAAGFLLTKATLDALGKMSLLSLTQLPARRALVLARDDLANDSRLAGHLRTLGVEVDEAVAEGHVALMLDPHESIVPQRAFRAMVEWLARATQTQMQMQTPTPTPTQTQTQTTERTAPGKPTSRANPHAVLAVDLAATDGSALREEVIHFGADESLLGVVTTAPVDRSVRGKTAVLFLNVGANHRVGPNRMYVVMARHLGALGFVAMRFDIAGLGDSAPRSGKEERRLYAMDSVDDVHAAIAILRERYAVDRVVLIGLCSGAYLAYHTAARLPQSAPLARVDGMVLINPQTFQWREGDSLKLAVRGSIKAQGFYRRAVLQPETWRRALRGEVNLRTISRGFGRRLWRKLETTGKRFAARVLGRKSDAGDVAGTLRDLLSAGTDVFMLFSAEDGGIDEMELHLGEGARRMRDQEHFRLGFVERADHTFTSISAQRRLRDAIAEHLIRRYG